MTDYDDLRRALRIARHQQGYSQRALAKIGGFRQAQLSGWETGKHMPNPHNLATWAESLGYALSYTLARL